MSIISRREILFLVNSSGGKLFKRIDVYMAMVKTTITIEDDLYKKLAKEAVDRYGTVRTLSRLINEKLREDKVKVSPGTKGLVEKAFGSLKINVSGEEYVKKLRKEWR